MSARSRRRLSSVNSVAAADEKALEIDGHELVVSHPDKVFFSEHGETKLDLVNHYLRFAEPVMRTMGGRPTLMQRFPEGASGSNFFQKRVPKSAPDWLETTIVSTPNGTTSRALVVADLAHVVWAVNIGCLGFHVWPNLAADPEHADELRPRLDPPPRHGLHRHSRGGSQRAGVPRRARDRRLPEDDGQPGHPCVHPARAALGLLRRPARRRRCCPRARAAPSRHHDGGVVEGGTRRA